MINKLFKQGDIKKSSITQIITGFDSAWTDKKNQPGAIASIIRYKNGECRWMEPRLATFSQAKTIICTLSEQTAFHFVGINRWWCPIGVVVVLLIKLQPL